MPTSPEAMLTIGSVELSIGSVKLSTDPPELARRRAKLAIDSAEPSIGSARPSIEHAMLSIEHAELSAERAELSRESTPLTSERRTLATKPAMTPCGPRTPTRGSVMTSREPRGYFADFTQANQSPLASVTDFPMTFWNDHRPRWSFSAFSRQNR